MAKTQKNVISFNQIEKVIKDNRIPKHTVKIGGDNSFIEVEINPYVSMSDYILMIDSIADNTFIQAGDKKVFVPSHFKISLVAALIRYFTNIKPDNNADRIWELEQVTGISLEIKKVIGHLYEEIVEDSISTIKETIRAESAKHKSDELFDVLINILNNVNTGVESFANTDTLANIADVVKKITNVSGEDVVNAIISKPENETDILNGDNLPSSIAEIPVLSEVKKAYSVAEE